MPPLKPTHKKPTAVTAGQHGLDHPAVFIHMPFLECECKHSHGEPGREKGGTESSVEASACRQGGEVYWIVSLSGLVAGFVYEFHFQWFVVEGADERKHYTWTINFSTSTSTYKVRQPLSQISPKIRGLNMDTIVGERRWWYRGRRNSYIPKIEPFEIEVTVRDMHPGLTSEEALIGTRRVSSAVNAVKVLCTDCESCGYTHVRSTSTGKAKFMNSCSFLFPFVQFDGKSGVTSASLLHGNGCFISMHPAMEPNCQIVNASCYGA